MNYEEYIAAEMLEEMKMDNSNVPAPAEADRAEELAQQIDEVFATATWLDLPTVNYDVCQLKEALVNLFVTAIEAQTGQKLFTQADLDAAVRKAVAEATQAVIKLAHCERNGHEHVRRRDVLEILQPRGIKIGEGK